MVHKMGYNGLCRTDMDCVTLIKEVSICSYPDRQGTVDRFQRPTASDAFPCERMPGREHDRDDSDIPTYRNHPGAMSVMNHSRDTG